MTQSFGPRLPISSEVAGHALPLFAVSAKITLRGGLFYLLLAPLAFSYLFLATDLYHHARFGGLLSLVEWWILHMTILYSFGMINVFTTTYNFQGPHPKFPASRQMSKILGSALRCLRLCGAKKVSATGIWKFFLEKKSCSDHIAPTYYLGWACEPILMRNLSWIDARFLYFLSFFFSNHSPTISPLF